MAPYHVRAEWDDEAEVWIASSDDVPGVATGADTLEALIDKLKIVIPELLEEKRTARRGRDDPCHAREGGHPVNEGQAEFGLLHLPDQP
jgi:predicted RNase H-like HicB family nuclease